ncbi:MAG: RNA pseudouridine synthase [Puniceicoccales bacterium]|nr:RNA pseudouridine synthase [Puniceicoccales bacterium]
MAAPFLKNVPTEREALLRSLLRGGAEIVAVDGNGLVAIGKPAGLLSHPNGPDVSGRRTPIAAPYDPVERAYRPPGGPPIYLLNRLDSATAGLLLLALEQPVARAVRESFRRCTVRKVYWAFAFAGRRLVKELWIDRLKKARDGERLRAAAGDREARTEVFLREMRSIGEFSLALLELRPITGRTHQLRYQCGRRQFPIVGDRTYGDFPLNRRAAEELSVRTLQLHSAEISLTYEVDGVSHGFSARSPALEDFLDWTKFSPKIFPAKLVKEG